MSELQLPTFPPSLGHGKVVTTLEMSDHEYHQLESLSSTGARTMLQAPAKYRWGMDNPRPYKPQFEVGHAVHTLVLGAGGDIVLIDAKDWRSKSARDERDAAVAEGKTPLLSKEYELVLAMRDAVMKNRTARRFFEDDSGVPELSILWEDEATGAPLRARTDWLIPGETIVDLKTTITASHSDWERRILDYWYHLQAAWYVEAINIAYDYVPDYHWVVVEKDPPYLTAVYGIEKKSLYVGLDLMTEAIDKYAHCLRMDYWPGYPQQSMRAGLPQWALKRLA